MALMGCGALQPSGETLARAAFEMGAQSPDFAAFLDANRLQARKDPWIDPKTGTQMQCHSKSQGLPLGSVDTVGICYGADGGFVVTQRATHATFHQEYRYDAGAENVVLVTDRK